MIYFVVYPLVINLGFSAYTSKSAFTTKFMTSGILAYTSKSASTVGLILSVRPTFKIRPLPTIKYQLYTT